MDLDDSILVTIKHMLGITDEATAFDEQIVAHINATFMTLRQLQVIDPDGYFTIHGENESWRDLIDDVRLLDPVRDFIYLRVRLLFDPPASSVVADAYNHRLAEVEWRLNSEAEKIAAQAEEGAAG